MNSSQKTYTRGSSRWICLWLTAWVAAAACFFWRGAERRSADRQIETTRASHTTPGTNESTLATRSIEHIQVGDRVWTDLPESLAEKAIGDTAAVPAWDRRDAAIDPADWRRIDLRMYGTDGDQFQIALLRPIDWIHDSGAAEGGHIHLTISEQGLDGPADVLAIGACPLIAEGPGRIVTGTFTHVRGGIVDMFLEGQSEPLGVTENHAVYSVDRDAFVYAGALRVGDRLRGLNGEAMRIARIERRSGQQRVYNLEVHGEHIYRVTASGLLVHNASTRYHSVYGDGTLVPEGQQPPRMTFDPDPNAVGPHTRLRWDPVNRRVYQGREFNQNGIPVRDIDMTNPTYPNGTPRPGHPGPPHQHTLTPNNPANHGAGYQRSLPEPLP